MKKMKIKKINLFFKTKKEYFFSKILKTIYYK